MTRQIIGILCFIIAVLLLVIWAYDSGLSHVVSERNRLENNYRELSTINTELVSTLEVRVEELTTTQKQKIDSLAKKLKVKPKNVNVYHEIHLRDTIRDTVEIKGYNCDSLRWNGKYKCIDIDFTFKRDTGFVNAKKDTYLYIVDYSQRRRLFNSRFLPRWGKKETFQTIIDECENDTILTNRKIIITE
jgi:hypothetical protein